MITGLEEVIRSFHPLQCEVSVKKHGSVSTVAASQPCLLPCQAKCQEQKSPDSFQPRELCALKLFLLGHCPHPGPPPSHCHLSPVYQLEEITNMAPCSLRLLRASGRLDSGFLFSWCVFNYNDLAQAMCFDSVTPADPPAPAAAAPTKANNEMISATASRRLLKEKCGISSARIKILKQR